MIVTIQIPVTSMSDGHEKRLVVSSVVQGYGFDIDGYGYGVMKGIAQYVDINLLINIDRGAHVILFSPKNFQKMMDEILADYPNATFKPRKSVSNALALNFNEK